ncbi:hypothetical protein K492DRAFT_207204 [Lichtheimia hyalospora FSU 10163]|nr:hypothetical protein K492DRAFT_207204 [Lichtheimia hyalospora FSU 10163]
MSTPARAEIHALYRNYLRLVRDWPADKVRPRRDMKQMLAQRVEETFRRPLENEHEPFDIKDAQQQLVALEKLLNNDFKNKYPLSDTLLSPASNPNYYSRLLNSLGTKHSPFKLFGKK